MSGRAGAAPALDSEEASPPGRSSALAGYPALVGGRPIGGSCSWATRAFRSRRSNDSPWYRLLPPCVGLSSGGPRPWRTLAPHASSGSSRKRKRRVGSRELVVVKKDDAALAQQPAEVEEVHEHAVEAVVPVYEREIKAAFLLDKHRQHDLRRLRGKLHQRPDARLLEHLKTAVTKPCLERIENDVPGLRITGFQQRAANVQ